MKRVLISGASGFVGQHMVKELERNGYEIFSACFPKIANEKKQFLLDITDNDTISEVIKKIRPSFLVHLAGFGSIVDSFKYPDECKKINCQGTKNILDALAKWASDCRTLIITSIHVYGSPKYSPIDENHPLSANSPYAESRIEQEEITKNYDLDIQIARSTNHSGPGQLSNFVVPEFCSQVIDIENKIKKPIIKVGNIHTKKDFLDVRDVVKAYRLMLEKGEKKGIYNVCSGKNISIKEILEIIIDKSTIDNIQIEIDKNKYREDDVKEYLLANNKLVSIGWEPTYPIKTTIDDTLKWIRELRLPK